MRVLRDSLKRCKTDPSTDCKMKLAIDFILTGKNCLTYRYILMTALTAKATNDGIDILSLQASDNSAGAYDARSLCSHVVFPFQRDFLNNVLDGSNEDPLVNNPGRNSRIQKSNKAAPGDPSKALNLLCDYLPTIIAASDTQSCLDYLISQCLSQAELMETQAASFSSTITSADIFYIRKFMSDLLDQNFGGAALLLVVTSVLDVLFFQSLGYQIVPHPVNQAGSSGKQMGDIDVYKQDSKPFLALELKDKPFTAAEVAKAAKTAFDHNAPSMLFIAGRASTISDELYRYFYETKKEYERKGMPIGIMTIDALLDYFFTTHYEINASHVFQLMDKTMEDIHATPEVMSWVYRKVEEL